MICNCLKGTFEGKGSSTCSEEVSALEARDFPSPTTCNAAINVRPKLETFESRFRASNDSPKPTRAGFPRVRRDDLRKGGDGGAFSFS